MKKALKITGWAILSIILLVLLAMTIIVWYLTPDRLTPIVEREASAMIDGRVKVSRVELTFWSSFPRLRVDIDSLQILSHSTRHLPDSIKASLPPYTDSLLRVDHMHGAINLISLAEGNIELYDLLIRHPQANIVFAADGATNLNIIPAEDSTEPTDEQPLRLPSISLDHFRLIDAGPITYTSTADSTFLAVSLENISLDGTTHPAYKLKIDGNATSPLLDRYRLTPLTAGLDGKITWDPERPAAVSVSDLDITVNGFNMLIDTDIDASDTQGTLIEKLDLRLSQIDINNIVEHLPLPMASKLSKLDTDMKIDASARLLSPYLITDSMTIPSVEATLSVPPSRFHLGNIHLDNIDMEIKATIDGEDIDRSKVDIDRLILRGRALDINLSGQATGPYDNPGIDGRLAANLRIGQLPREFLDRLPVSLAGRLQAETGVRMHLKDLSAKGFHNIYLDGRISLRDFSLLSRDTLLSTWARQADFEFGTQRSFNRDGSRIDSLLTISLNVDTTSVSVPGLKLQGSDLTAALGSNNRSSSADTTAINPFGGLIKFKSLILDQPADTMTVRLRDVETHASITRYNGTARYPLMHFDLTARRIGTRIPGFAIAISQPLISVNAHLIPTDAKADSIRSARRARMAGLRRDSTFNRSKANTPRQETIDWNVSNDLKTLLKRWDVDGTMKSDQAFIFTRSFPLRQRASDINLCFNTDTVRLDSLKYNIGRTRLDIKGSVTNIERALTSRSGRAKLNINLDVNAPFIDVNELATTTFYEPSGYAGPDPDYDEEEISIATHSNTDTDTTVARPILIPRNIEANLSVKADSILYSDLLMHAFNGEVLVNNSAVNLRDLRASTEIGSASMSALYWAPDTAHMQFGMALKLNRFHIDRVLTLIPAVDSLLPALQGFAGVINADMAATAAITPQMDFNLPSFKGALKLDGDSLVLLDADTFKMLAKWLIFKNKKRNMIDHMNVEIIVDNSQVEIFPFIFDIDRYKLGVMGRNDLDMNLDYHVSVLKSPLPFKFGINIKGNLDDPKIRLGGAKIKPGQSLSYSIADTTRISLLGQIEEVFRRGSMSSQSMSLRHTERPRLSEMGDTTLSANDSLLMQREGFLPPDTISAPDSVTTSKKRKFLWNR